jgi:hypothetical protein
MSETEKFEVKEGNTYGKLPATFNIEIGKQGYFSVSGLNNAGKSTILQWLFSQSPNSLYIPAERGVVQPTIGSGTLGLGQYVNTFKANVQSAPLDVRQLGSGGVAFGTSVRFAEMNGYNECLLPSMIRDKGITTSITELAEYVKSFSLGEQVNDRNDDLLIDNRSITQMGTGARSLLMIIMALIHPDYTTILIDEPELFLEPRAQKALRGLLIQKGAEKRIVVATHSHLFLNRIKDQYEHNFYLDNDVSTSTTLKKTSNKSDLRNLTFKLLGASFDDLMLPENYLIVEGAGDSVVMTKVLELIDTEKAAKIQVAYAQGIQNAPTSVNAISEMVRPYYAEDSIYRDRIVCLIDEPVNRQEENKAAEIERNLNTDSDKRFFKLGTNPSGDKLYLESAIPEAVYERTSYNKSEVITEIARLKRDKKQLDIYKTEVTNALAESLTADDLSLDDMKVFKEAAKKAIKPIE